jgi:thymidylate kinase
MSRLSYRVISCEGGDQCGKGDAILTFRKKFLERGVSITFSSFPLYASPFDRYKEIFNNGWLISISPPEGLKIKMALYD